VINLTGFRPVLKGTMKLKKMVKVVVLCMYVCMYCLTSYESLPGGMKDG
jgi:hypothetical protein